jgi:hypothetical protein
MTSPELDNLVKIGRLKAEPPADRELAGLLSSGIQRLKDASREDLAYASRFDLAYNAAHALALFALRRAGYRSDNRYIVFQALQHTIGMTPAKWRVLGKAHERRNAAEYLGYLEQDDVLLEELIAITNELRKTLERGREKRP